VKIRIERPKMPVSALLADIGNTRIGIASWYDGQMQTPQSTALEALTSDPARLRQAWATLPEGSVRFVVISSVAPRAFDSFVGLLADVCDEEEIVVVGRDVPPPIEVFVPQPEQVGTDRLCAAGAAYDKVQAACVVASFGTAVTIDLVSDDGAFLGGAILPGLATAARALHERTALLPRVELAPPTEVWGTDTDEAIRVGIFCGLTGALRQITERYATELGRWPPLILTGGDAELIGRACEFADAVAPDLCLRGIALALERAVAQADDGS
jgi:type III pantothenate kinase